MVSLSNLLLTRTKIEKIFEVREGAVFVRVSELWENGKNDVYNVFGKYYAR